MRDKKTAKPQEIPYIYVRYMVISRHQPCDQYGENTPANRAGRIFEKKR